MQNPLRSPTFHRRLRTIPLLLGVFIVVAAAAYSAAWYMQASSARNLAVELTNELNNGKVAVHYSALETTGFPFDAKIRMVHPKLSIHMDTPADAATTPATNRVDEFTLGSLTFSVNLASTRFNMQAEGPLMQTSIVGDTRSAVLARLQGPLTCALDLAGDGDTLGNPWNLKRLLQQNESSLGKNFRMIECAAPGSIVGTETPQAPLMSTGPFLLRLSNLPEAGGLRTLGLVVKVENFEITPGMNELLSRHADFLPGGPPSADLAAYGKQNIDIGFALRGPADLHAYTVETPFSVTLARFNISNALYRTNSSLQLDNRVENNRHSIAFFLNSDSDFSKEYDTHVANYLHLLAAQMQTSQDPSLAPAKQVLSGMTPDQVMATVQPLIPRLNEFGTIGLHINANVEGDRDLRNGAVTVGTFDISTTPYGLSIQGSATLPQAAGQAPSNANFVLTCRNCLALVDDAMHYAQRLQQTLATLSKSPTPALPTFSPELAKGVQAFLSTIGEPKHDPAAGAESLTFALMTDPSGKPGLNGKTPAQVMDIYNADITPYLSAPAAAAAPAAPEGAAAPATPAEATPPAAPAVPASEIPPGGIQKK